MRSTFGFNGKINRDARAFFILPEEPVLFSYSLFAVWSFINYFTKDMHIFYPADGKVFVLDYLFKNSVHRFKLKKNKEVKKLIGSERGVDVVINLEYEFASDFDFELDKPYFCVSQREVKNATVTFIPSTSKADVLFLKFACTLGTPLAEFQIAISPQDKAKAKDFCKYKGHSEKNILVISDMDDVKKELAVKEFLSQVLMDRVTFIDSEALKTLNPQHILPLISLADLFIARNSVYVYPAQVLGVRTYLFRGNTRILPSDGPKLFVEKEDFRKELRLLLPSKK